MNLRAVLVTLVLLALGVVLDMLTGSKNLPGYSATIGLLGGIAIILAAKFAGRFLLRSEESGTGTVAGAAERTVHDG